MRSPVFSRFSSPAALLLACLLVGCGQQAGPPGPSPETASDLPASATSTAPAGSTHTPGSGNKKPGGYRRFRAVCCLDHLHNGGRPADLRPSGSLERGGPGRRAAGGRRRVRRDHQPCRETAGHAPDQHGNRLHLHGRYPYSVLDSQDLTALTLRGATPRFVFETRGTADGSRAGRYPGGGLRHHVGPAAVRGLGVRHLPLLHLAAHRRHVRGVLQSGEQ